MATKVFVFGASGHAKVVIDILERMPDIEVAFAIDDATAVKGRSLCGYNVIGGRDELLVQRATVTAGIVTIGDNAARREIAADTAFDHYCEYPIYLRRAQVRVIKGKVVKGETIIIEVTEEIAEEYGIE